MPTTNRGPASTVTPNSTPADQSPIGGQTGVLFANLATGFKIGEIAYTSDSGLCYWNGTAWNAVATSTALTTSITAAAKDQYRLLAQGKALNVNAVGDIGVLAVQGSTLWTIKDVVASNLSTGAGTSVAIGVMSATAGAAVTIVAPQILSGLVAFGGATVDYRFTVQNVSFAGNGQTIYVNCQTTAGVACTLDVSIYGYDLS